MKTNNAPLAATETYAGAYARLSAIAEKLRTSAGATSVDSLVEDVRAAQSTEAPSDKA